MISVIKYSSIVAIIFASLWVILSTAEHSYERIDRINQEQGY